MVSDRHPTIPEVGPREAWNILSNEASAALVDVRSPAEWTFVGTCDLSDLGKEVLHHAWTEWPDPSPNPEFAGTLLERGGDLPTHLLFICRSGVRSMRAASAVQDALRSQDTSVTCLNVAEGFEGDLDSEGRRGVVNGWKALGLPWQQS